MSLKDVIRKRVSELLDVELAGTVQVVTTVTSVDSLIDDVAPDIEFCQLDYHTEQSDDMADPMLHAMRKEREQGGPLAFCVDVLVA